jgi:hypothetical protein
MVRFLSHVLFILNEERVTRLPAGDQKGCMFLRFGFVVATVEDEKL